MKGLGIRKEYRDKAPTHHGMIINVDSYMPGIITIIADVYLKSEDERLTTQTTKGATTNLTQTAVTIQRIELSIDEQDVENTTIIDYLEDQAKSIVKAYNMQKSFEEQYGTLPSSF